MNKKRVLIVGSLVAVVSGLILSLAMPYVATAAAQPKTAKQICEGAGGKWDNDNGCSCVPLGIGINDKTCPATTGSELQQNVIYDWLLAIIRFLSAGVGIAVTGGIVTGGILYLTARDNAGQTQKAVTIIVNALIGLLLYILMFAILNFLIPGGILT